HLTTPPPTQSPLFPYTTLFRSSSHSKKESLVPAIATRATPQSLLAKLPRPSWDVGRHPACPGNRSCKRRARRPANRQAAEFFERSEEHTSELQSLAYLVCRLLL